MHRADQLASISRGYLARIVVFKEFGATLRSRRP